MHKKRVLMCCSSLDYKGGMVSVVKNYLDWQDWDEFDINFVPTHIPGAKLKAAAHFAGIFPDISRALRKGKYDLVHLHVAERGSFYRKALIVREAKKRGIPVILHHHAAEFEQFYRSLDAKKKAYVRNVCELADVNIVLSRAIRDMMLVHSPKARFEVLYNAVPTYTSNFYDADAKDVVFMGRIGKRKGVFDLVDAFSKILFDIDDGYRLVLCGDGEIAEAESRIERKQLKGRAICKGWIDSEERISVLRGAVLNVLPSYNEGLPMSILEAMSFGIPTVSTNIAAIPEVIISGVSGELIEPGSVDVLANVLVTLLNDKEKRQLMSDNAYRIINRSFALDSHVTQIKEAYRILC